jgi:S-adenosylmethionine:tRNA ribosyltransferase-isomerase
VNLPAELAAGDLLVGNDTRVLPARLVGRKQTGGRVECLLERMTAPTRGLFQLRASRSPGLSAKIHFEAAAATVVGRSGPFFELDFDDDLESLLEAHGEVPLPPYIARAAEEADRARYQTVYAKRAGAVAAPTAGLHFDQDLLDALAATGVEIAFITLHVGAGTFAPLREEQLATGRLHTEWVQVSADLVAAVERTRARGGRIVAVGTTTVRALESAAITGPLAACDGETDIFITPGFTFRVVDAMVTNFHLPRSSLLMLVAAFAGRDTILAAYRHAVRERYRFFSYGDAMLLWPEFGRRHAI